jgi:hypothetical protein
MTSHTIKYLPAPVRPAQGTSSFDELSRAFTTLYAVAQHSVHVFGSPLDPIAVGETAYHLPRFVYFGPQFSDESVRLALYAGFDGTDDRPTRALLHMVERLALKPDLGEGLNLTFFPLVNPSGLARNSRESAAGFDVGAAHWNLSEAPEISLLAHDARLRAYHGFVRVETGLGDEIVATVRSGSRAGTGNDSLLVDSSPHAHFPVRWHVEKPRLEATCGPLTLADDLAISPFEITLQIPDTWNTVLYSEAVLQVLKGFIIHYRATYAYGIHL